MGLLVNFCQCDNSLACDSRCNAATDVLANRPVRARLPAFLSHPKAGSLFSCARALFVNEVRRHREQPGLTRVAFLHYSPAGVSIPPRERQSPGRQDARLAAFSCAAGNYFSASFFHRSWRCRSRLVISPRWLKWLSRKVEEGCRVSRASGSLSLALGEFRPPHVAPAASAGRCVTCDTSGRGGR